MKRFEELSMNDAISLYYEKHHAMQEGNLEKLRHLKNQHPELFTPEMDTEIRDIIEYAKKFQNSERYKELLKLDLKKKFILINNDLPPEKT